MSGQDSTGTAVPSRAGRGRARRVEPGPVYIVTIRLAAGRWKLTDGWSARRVLAELDRLHELRWAKVHFSVVMPDHVTVVLQPLSPRTLAQVVSEFKQRTSRAFNRNRAARLWTAQYNRHHLRPDEKLPDAIRYCWYGPARAGLVAKPADYPFWRSRYPLP
jgi:REP element-mobilizing transposase RayT